MTRVHLFEILDQSWVPAFVRDACTAYLELIARIGGQHRALAPLVRRALEKGGETRIVDLCSGGGGAIAPMVSELDEAVTITLTDWFPNHAAMRRAANASDRIDFAPEAIDARAVPSHLPGVRTLFNALHHFRPDDARGILADAAHSGQPIVVCEVTRRHPLLMIALLFTPILCLLSVPFLRPFDWRWFVFTYVLPVIPFVIVWDGLVSCLRVYSPDELRALVANIDAPGAVWEIGEQPMGASPIDAFYLVGYTPTRA